MVYILVGIPACAFLFSVDLSSAAVISAVFFVVGGVYYWVKGMAKERGIETPKFP